MTTELAWGDLVSDRYASALYDLASEKKIVDHVLTDLLLIKEIIDKHEELKLVIKSPLIVSNDKLKILRGELPLEVSDLELEIYPKIHPERHPD